MPGIQQVPADLRCLPNVQQESLHNELIEGMSASIRLDFTQGAVWGVAI